MKTYNLTRSVLSDECPWLEEEMLEGDIVYEYTGHTYGCITPNGTAVTFEPDKAPFFELPNDSLKEI